MKDFIRLLLVPNPQGRPNIKQVLDILEKWGSLPRIDLPQEAIEIKMKQTGQEPALQETLSQPKMVAASKDLTADDIFKLQEKIKAEQ